MKGIACFLSVAGTGTISAGVIAVFALSLLAFACHSVATSPAAAEVLGRLRERVERLRRHGYGPPRRAARSVRFRRQRLMEVRQQLKERGRFVDGHVGQVSRDAALKAGTWGPEARGFTLIELLVVMTIIILLAAFLLPALGRAGAKGREMHYLGNLAQTWSRSGVTQVGSGQSGLPPALPTANVNMEAAVRVTNLAASGVSDAAAANPEPPDEWDTPRFRLFVFLFKLILILYLLAGAVIVTLYFLNKRKQQDTDPGGRV